MNIDFGWFTTQNIVGWVISVGVATILLNVASTFLQRHIDKFLGNRTEKTRTKKIVEETKMLLKLRRLHDQQPARDAEIAITIIQFCSGCLLTLMIGLFYLVTERYSISLSVEDFNNDIRAKVTWMVASILMLLSLIILGRRLKASMDMLVRLRDFDRQEAAYLKLAGKFPDNYVPLFSKLPE